jgi:nicotinate-nucleotide adenylyltransferase
VTQRPRRRIAVLGGRFDPPHLGHLMIAQEAWWRLGLDELIFVPAGLPADRPAPQFPGDLRAAMVEAAIDGHPGWRCSRTEIDRPGPSYTADTMAELAAREPGAELWFVMGADRLAGFAAWHEPERILSFARLAVISRGGIDAPGLQATAAAVAPGRVDVLEAPEVDVSSTMVRERLAAGAPIEYLVPAGVARLLASADPGACDG